MAKSKNVCPLGKTAEEAKDCIHHHEGVEVRPNAVQPQIPTACPPHCTEIGYPNKCVWDK